GAEAFEVGNRSHAAFGEGPSVVHDPVGGARQQLPEVRHRPIIAHGVGRRRRAVRTGATVVSLRPDLGREQTWTTNRSSSGSTSWRTRSISSGRPHLAARGTSTTAN